MNRRMWGILQKCMETNPEHRYSSVREVRKALEGAGRQNRACCVIIAALAAGCLAAGNEIPKWGEEAEIREKTYDELLAEGGEENCMKAISRDAGRSEAYFRLLDIYLEDDKFSAGEEEKNVGGPGNIREGNRQYGRQPGICVSAWTGLLVFYEEMAGKSMHCHGLKKQLRRLREKWTMPIS